MKKTHDYTHCYRGYWSDGGRCRIRIYHEDGRVPVVICSQLPDNPNTSVTNVAEYLAAEVTEEQCLHTPLVWVEHYPEHEGEIGSTHWFSSPAGESRRSAWEGCGVQRAAGPCSAANVEPNLPIRRPIDQA